MQNKETNDLHIELLSVNAMNAFARNISSSRAQMSGSHLSQMLVVKGSTQRNIQTGVEVEFGKCTFNVAMPEDGEILEIIERYAATLGQDSIKENPETLVIYENIHTKEIGTFALKPYCTNHQYFGYEYTAREGMKHLRVGAMIPKGTVFLDSPNVDVDGTYKYGIECNVALMTHPAVSEDGYLICEDMLDKFSFKTYESRTAEWGQKQWALNLYGDENNYKPFPDIGDYIREDGILMAFRDYDPVLLSPVEMSVKDCREVDLTFDTTIYANGPGGKVIDVKIHHDLCNSNFAEVNMDAQSQKYDDARRVYYGKIVNFYQRMKKKRGEALVLTPEFHRLIVESLSVTTEEKGQKVSKLYRQTPLDDYRVEIVIEYDNKISIGNKQTDLAGGKGVICAIAKREEMPVDEHGNSADIIMDPNATISRMNVGRLYEQYFNAAARDVHKFICRKLDIAARTDKEVSLITLSGISDNVKADCLSYLVNFYGIMNDTVKEWFMNGMVNQDTDDLLSDIIQNGVSIYFPPNNPKEVIEIVKEIENSPYRPVYGRVSYIGNSGIRTTTKDKVRIGSMYIILLEKIGDDWSAVSSSKLQHFGVLAQLTKQDKFSKPARLQAVRGAGEAEVRIFASYVGEDFVAELMDRNNSPVTHKEMVMQLLKAEKPGNIYRIIDRDKLPFGGSKPLQLVKHILATSGFRFKYKPFKSNW